MNCCNDFGQCTQGQHCPARPAAVTRVKVSHCTRAEAAPVIPQPTPVRRAPMDDELQLSNWDRFWFWGTVSVAGVCTLVVIVGGVGWAYGKYMA
ncbi:hypothetical protein AEP_00543 [Curvibacter sp. AEP1-3]|uniref:hypothetical protein n=1 Tax=Curvibacter sp. AEP1-3 TaxID=1844971 RepID=UPI000B3C9363|nr:hypothetical protein [Curvibacter sp. AEP1-3]ARV17503.1 hypothetical protein AEP_00543 [Curvibacter sp. AEP1-3]